MSCTSQILPFAGKSTSPLEFLGGKSVRNDLRPEKFKNITIITKLILYSQTCVQRPTLGPQKSDCCVKGGRCSEVGPKYVLNSK